MQLSVYDIMSRVECMRNIMVLIEEDKPIGDYMDYIHDMLEEYSDILQSAKVKIC